MAAEYKRLWYPNLKEEEDTEQVGCDSLEALKRRAGLGGHVTFLSLDVEGAEELVLQTVDPGSFTVVVVELDGHDPPKDQRVHDLLTKGGLRLGMRLHLGPCEFGGCSEVYISPKLEAKLRSPANLLTV